MSETVRVSEVLKEALETIRDDGGHTNIDSAMREVFHHSDMDLYDYVEEEGGLEAAVNSDWDED